MKPLEISVHELKQALEGDREILLVDCRESDERSLCAIEGSLHVPMAEIPERLAELRSDADRALVVYCHHGGRSMRATTWLRQQGVSQAQSLAGGIDAWAVEIEPGMPRY